ncbi:sterol desaturase family protein [Bacteroidales bacterium AH-315-I05]|nr:sterol desaturase family protein [Bacteroidales bacterium AH-315-I05]
MSENFFISNSEKSPPLYDSPFLEFFTRCHFIVPVVIYTPLAGYFLYRSIFIYELGFIPIVVLWLAAAISWTLLEYIIHRYFFHLKTNNKTLTQIIYNTHGKHHDYPNDRTRLVVMPMVSIPASFVFYGIFYLLLGEVYANPFYAGFIGTYILYELMHYGVHAWDFNNPTFQNIKRNHLMHHYRDISKGFGFTTMLWDRVLKTYFKTDKSEN